jgi:hypothetical protein
MRLGVVFACLAVSACGGARPESRVADDPPTSSGAECSAREALAAAQDALGTCRAAHASDAGWPARGEYETVLPHLASHLASLDPPREVTSDEVQPLAEQIWELLDQVEFPAGSEAARGRAETAAERLLRERDARAAPGAAIEALDAVTQIGVVADPSGGVDPCAAEDLHVGEARLGESACESQGHKDR